MDTYRLFIAINIPPTVQQSLSRVQQSFKVAKGLRFSSLTNLHLTLQFLGNVPVAKIDSLQTALQQQASTADSFNIRLNNLGAFPNFKKPRVVWAGPSNTNTALLNLRQQIINATKSVGFADGKRAFKPHLTIARVHKWAKQKEYKQIKRVIEENPISVKIAFSVTEIHLIRSQLLPEGPRYSILKTVELQPLKNSK